MFVVRVLMSWQDSTHAHAEIERIKCRTEIDVERVVDGPGKYPHSVPQVVYALFEQFLILGHGERSDVRWNCKQRAAAVQISRNAVPDHGDCIGLAEAQTF